MCGLIGYSGSVVADKTTLQILMMENDSRGGHSTGYYDGKNFHKVIGKSDGLFSELGNMETKSFIGHTRYATHGIISKPNQHPFQYGNVVGAHNGVVRNYVEVGEKFNLNKTDVDSQMIFKTINHNGDFDNLGLFSGTLATLFTIGDGKYYAYRHQNPLYVGIDENGGSYFSSLKEPLEYCNLMDIYQLKENTLYVYEHGKVIDRISVKRNEVYSASRVSTNWADYMPNSWTTPKTKTNKKSKQKKYKTINKHYGLSARKEAHVDLTNVKRTSMGMSPLEHELTHLDGILETMRHIYESYEFTMLQKDEWKIKQAIDTCEELIHTKENELFNESDVKFPF